MRLYGLFNIVMLVNNCCKTLSLRWSHSEMCSLIILKPNSPMEPKIARFCAVDLEFEGRSVIEGIIFRVTTFLVLRKVFVEGLAPEMGFPN